MERMKTFGAFALLTIVFFIFSNCMINVCIKSCYTPIDSYVALRDNVKIEIQEARATYVNGYVGGTVTNTGTNMPQAYLKIDLYSPRNVLLGTKYVTMQDWKQGEQKSFKMGFKLTDADYCKVSIVNEISTSAEEGSFISEELRGARLMAKVMILCLI